MGNKCRFCGKKLRWEKDDYTGRWVPLDQFPNPEGDYQTTPSGCLKLGPQGKLAHHGLLYTRHSCAERQKTGLV